jgi:hypothetical protein
MTDEKPVVLAQYAARKAVDKVGAVVDAVAKIMRTPSELRARFRAEAEERILGEAQMMRIGGMSATDQAGLLGNRFHMLPVANVGARLCQDGFVDTRCPISPSAAPSSRFGFLGGCGLVGHKGRELGLKGQIDLLGIGKNEAGFCIKPQWHPDRRDEAQQRRRLRSRAALFWLSLVVT